MNIWVRTIIAIINKGAPSLVHECPYYVSPVLKLLFNQSIDRDFCRKGMDVKNASWDLNLVPSVFPSGDYKLIFGATIQSEFAGTVNLMASVDSSNKDTFG